MEFILGGLFALLLMYALQGGAAKDDTDPPSGRSGMRLYTDHKTGLQYLGNPMGGITPRLDATGKQMKAQP
jgi:hypothetical protein